MRSVVVFLQPGSVPHTRQLADCLAHCNLHAYHIVAVVPPHSPADAVKMVLSGEVDLIVAAYSPRARPGDLRDLAAAAGASVDYVRAPTVRREIVQLLVAMVQRSGGDVSHVAREVGWTSQELRSVLSRMGTLRNDTPTGSRRRAGRRDDAG